MKEIAGNLKKKIAMIMAGFMIMSMLPTNTMTARAEEEVMTEVLEPRTETFATKEQIMKDFCVRFENVSNNRPGHIRFGKNINGETMWWWIVAEDWGITGDNITLFADTLMIPEITFDEEDKTDKRYDETWGCTYSGQVPYKVAPNHYGACDIRMALKEMEKDTRYFTPGEQAMMNPTPIKVLDYYAETYYTVVDKLYLPTGEYEEEYITLGSRDDLILDNAYWGSYESWLRTPAFSERVALYIPRRFTAAGQIVGAYALTSELDVRPATNLSLENVAFAASAEAVTSDIKTERVVWYNTAMGLRMCGQDVISSSVGYTADAVVVMPKQEEQGLCVIVQGRDSVGEWYYSQAINQANKVTVSAVDIQEAVGLPDVPDLTTCKIWIEKTKEDGLAYAVMAEEMKTIQSIAVTDIDTPIAGMELDGQASCETEGIETVLPAVTYEDSAGTICEKADYNTIYTANITLSPAAGYTFTEDILPENISVNGDIPKSYIVNQDGTMTIYYEFPRTAKAKLLNIIQPAAITGVANGTERTAAALGLPENVEILTEDVSVTKAEVSWNLATLADGTYDPAVTTEQTFSVQGEVCISEEIDSNNKELKIKISVTVSAKTSSSTDEPEDKENKEDKERPWPFTDIPKLPGYWKYDNVRYVYERDIMNGIAGTTLFDPDGNLNRAMFATVLYRMAGNPQIEFSDVFTDVEDGKYYSKAIMWVNQQGIAKGFGDGSYGVTMNITREQIAKMLYEYASKQGYDVSGSSSLDAYTDKDSVNVWAYHCMQWAVHTGMITGKPNEDGSYRLDPKGDATRAECAKMLTMFLKKYEP